MSMTAFKNAALAMETTRGTAVNVPVRTIAGEWVLNSDPNKVERENEHIQSLAMVQRGVVVGTKASMSVQMNGVFELLPYFFKMLGSGAANSTAVTASSNRVGSRWAFTPNVRGGNAQKTATFHFQDGVKRYIVPFGFLDKMELGFALEDVVQLSADFMGNYPTQADVLTDTIPEVSGMVDMVSANETTIDIDVGGTGTYVPLTDTILNATLRMTSGLTPQGHLSSGLGFGFLTEGKRRWELEFTAEHNALAASTLYSLMGSDEVAKLRLTHYGPALGGGSTRRALVFEMYAQTRGGSHEVLGDDNGRTTLSMAFGSVPARSGVDVGKDITNLSVVCAGDPTI